MGNTHCAMHIARCASRRKDAGYDAKEQVYKERDGGGFAVPGAAAKIRAVKQENRNARRSDAVQTEKLVCAAFVILWGKGEKE